MCCVELGQYFSNISEIVAALLAMCMVCVLCGARTIFQQYIGISCCTASNVAWSVWCVELGQYFSNISEIVAALLAMLHGLCGVWS